MFKIIFGGPPYFQGWEPLVYNDNDNIIPPPLFRDDIILIKDNICVACIKEMDKKCSFSAFENEFCNPKTAPKTWKYYCKN